MNAPRGVWLATGTTLRQPYPCRCPYASEWEHTHGRCPCWGRTDVRAMVAGCCGWAWLQRHRSDLLTFQWSGS